MDEMSVNVNQRGLTRGFVDQMGVPNLFEESTRSHTVGCCHLPFILYQGRMDYAKPPPQTILRVRMKFPEKIAMGATIESPLQASQRLSG